MFDMTNSNLGDARIWDSSYVQVSGMKLVTLSMEWNFNPAYKYLKTNNNPH